VFLGTGRESGLENRLKAALFESRATHNRNLIDQRKTSVARITRSAQSGDVTTPDARRGNPGRLFPRRMASLSAATAAAAAAVALITRHSAKFYLQGVAMKCWKMLSCSVDDSH